VPVAISPTSTEGWQILYRHARQWGTNLVWTPLIAYRSFLVKADLEAAAD
jgi:hypothetical protein